MFTSEPVKVPSENYSSILTLQVYVVFSLLSISDAAFLSGAAVKL